MEGNVFFKQGDFIKQDKTKGSFMIFEGNNYSQTAYKRLSVICSYDPEKYKRTANGEYRNVPDLEVATKLARCEKTVDTDKEDYWIKLCTPLEKKAAIEILAQYGYEWDEENLALVSTETGEIIRKITTPNNEYHGEVVKPIAARFKDLLKGFCQKANKTSYSYPYQDYDYFD